MDRSILVNRLIKLLIHYLIYSSKSSEISYRYSLEIKKENWHLINNQVMVKLYQI